MDNLYQIASNYKSIWEEISQSEELSDEQMELINSVEDDLQNKLINISSIVKTMEAEASAIQNAMNDLEKRFSSKLSKIERLKEYVKSTMEICNLKSVKSALFDMNIRYNPPSLLVENESNIPAEFFITKTSIILDKRKLSNLLLNDENFHIEGVSLQRKTRLEIK